MGVSRSRLCALPRIWIPACAGTSSEPTDQGNLMVGLRRVRAGELGIALDTPFEQADEVDGTC